MIDNEQSFPDSLISSDNEINEQNLLSQLKVNLIEYAYENKQHSVIVYDFCFVRQQDCEQEMNRLKVLLDENCENLKNDDQTTGQVTRSLTDELTEVRDSLFSSTLTSLSLTNRLQKM